MSKRIYDADQPDSWIQGIWQGKKFSREHKTPLPEGGKSLGMLYLPTRS